MGQIVFNVVAFGAGLYAISNFIFNTQYKSTGAYKMSMRLLESSPEIMNEIGVPLKARYSISGHRYGGHKLYLEWKIVGPGGEATIICRNSFVGRKGTIEELSATFADKRVLQLVSSPVSTDPLAPLHEADKE